MSADAGVETSRTPVLAAVAGTARLTQLDASGLLVAESDPTFDRFARLAAALVGAPVSFVSLVGMEGQFTPGMVRVDAPDDDRRSMAVEDSFCQYAISTGEPLVIEDTRTDLLVRDTPYARSGEIQAYAGIPLRTDGGHLLGTLCVMDRRPRSWRDGELALLNDLTVTVRQEIEHRLHAGRLLGAQGAARQMADGVERLSDATRALVQHAEGLDDARLHRFSAVTATRLDAVRKLARDLRELATDSAGPVPREVGAVDVRRAAERSVASVRAATRTSALELGPLPPAALPVRADALVVEAAITHVLVSTLHRSASEGTVHLEVAAVPSAADALRTAPGTAAAELRVRAPGAQLPATELARVVGRLHDVTTGEADGGRTDTSAALRMAGGMLTAQSGPVRGTSSAQGTTVVATWPLHDAQGAALSA